MAQDFTADYQALLRRRGILILVSGRGNCYDNSMVLRRENSPLDCFLILLTFGWAKTGGGMAQTVYRGVKRVRSRFILTMAANNLARLPRLLAA